MSALPMKKHILAIVMMAAFCSSRLAADYVIWTDYQQAGKTVELRNTGNASNYFELWRWTEAYPDELIARWEVYIDYNSSSVNNYNFTHTITNYSSTVTHSGDAYNMTFSNLPEGYYYFSIGEGGGYPTTNWYGAWNGASGAIGWHAANSQGAFSYSIFDYNIHVRDFSMFEIELY
jgi:hypothetical protein